MTTDNVHHIGKLTERELDAQIAANKALYDAHLGTAMAEALVRIKARRVAVRPARPSVIPLDTSLAARFLRWLRAFFLNLRSPL